MLPRSLFAVGTVLVLGACSTSQAPITESLPDKAMPVGPEALVTDELVATADLHEGDELYLLPASQGRLVLVRLRTGEPPLLFGTSCDSVSSVSLPAGWEGVCLEYTLDGRRVHGQFQHGTFSVNAFPGAPPSNSPEAAVVAAHLGDLEFAQTLVSRMVAIYTDEETVDLRARIEEGEFCRSYAVFGVMEAGRFLYWASPAGAC